MKSTSLLKYLPVLVGLAVAQSVAAAEFDRSHALFDGVLAKRVENARVDYAALKAQPEELDRYLRRVAAVERSGFEQWGEADQIAFLINAYNAYTLRLIIDHHPVKSIKDIGSFFKGPWDRPIVGLFGRTITLNVLEHEILRKDYDEPRVHFALVCAAKGCPPLRSEAYVGSRLDEQLDDQARRFLSETAKNRVDAPGRTVHLSPIFKWYGDDFEKDSRSVLEALKPYWPDRPGSGYEAFKIRYTDYDWSLNERSR